MPKTTKDLLKRKAGLAYVNLSRAGVHLQSIITPFKPVHPELSEGLEIAQDMIIEILKIIDTFANVSWGMSDTDWEAWVNEPEYTPKVDNE